MNKRSNNQPAYQYEAYSKRVNQFILNHPENIAIHKLTHNIPINRRDYGELERILTQELGSKEDYASSYEDTPFGLLIRQVAKLDRQAAMEAFSGFINDQSLNQRQIAFLEKVIDYLAQNGYMKDVMELTKAPFDKPYDILQLFDQGQQKTIVEIVKSIRQNAVEIVA